MSMLIAYRNLADTAPSVAGPSRPTFPVSNLLTRQLKKTWRGDPGSTIVVDLGEVRTIRSVGFIAPNRQPNSGDSSYVEVSTDGNVWHANWMIAANDHALPGLPNLSIAIQPIDNMHDRARYLRIKANWTPQNGADYVEAGRLWISNALELPDNCDGNWELSVRDRGQKDEAEGGDKYVDKGVKERTLRVAITNMPTEIAYGFEDGALSAADVPSIQGLQWEAGTTDDVLALIRAADNDTAASLESAAIWMRRAGIYGYLTDDSLTIRHEDGPLHSTNLTFVGAQ